MKSIILQSAKKYISEGNQGPSGTGRIELASRKVTGSDGGYSDRTAKAYFAKAIAVADRFGIDHNIKTTGTYRDGYLFPPADKMMAVLKALDSAPVEYKTIDLPKGMDEEKVKEIKDKYQSMAKGHYTGIEVNADWE